MGSDADLPDAPSRIWKGRPASSGICSMGKRWPGGRKCAPTSTMPKRRRRWPKRGDPTAFAMANCQARLEGYDFPALITAEWGQEARLFRLYDDPKTRSPAR